MDKPEALPHHNVNTGSPDQEWVEQIWSQRAVQMAQTQAVEEPGVYRNVALIYLGSELLGLDVADISEVLPVEKLTRVPRVPEWIAGIANLRGQFLSVIDLAKYIGLPAHTDRENSSLVVVQHQKMEVIFLVSNVIAVESLKEQNAQADDAITHHLPEKYVRAVVEMRGNASEQRYMTVLDVEGLLSDQHFVIHEVLP
jgi:purine-binding chemotaxis protein CheW